MCVCVCVCDNVPLRDGGDCEVALSFSPVPLTSPSVWGLLSFLNLELVYQENNECISTHYLIVLPPPPSPLPPLSLSLSLSPSLPPSLPPPPHTQLLVVSIINDDAGLYAGFSKGGFYIIIKVPVCQVTHLIRVCASVPV